MLASASLAAEVGGVTVATVLLLRLLRNGSDRPLAWFLTPFLLMTAAIVPALLRKRGLAGVGLRLGRLGLILPVLCATCLVVLPILVCAIVLLRYCQVGLPLCPMVPKGEWFSWLTHQFLIVAVPEEIFFRGYLQTNILRLLTMTVSRNPASLELLSIIPAAAIFAVSHSVLLGQIEALITFFPSLLFGWLYVKTKSLLAPILFHGLANAGYGFIAAFLA
ncbi:MAG: hypothetical protein AMJ75_00130 [Phycisphaerae bacterium SM1_79]|nr:MAG: hypothetical protein AMJ75_00130 [Phycisphaerae bacterium SM1_79]